VSQVEMASLLQKVIEESLSSNETKAEELGWIYPSSLARGCILAVAFELLGAPKREPESRVKRIFQVGNSSHSRILRYFSKVMMAQEVPFLDEEYRLKGRSDAILFLPPGMGQNPGFYVLEIKTVSSMEYELIKDEGQPREEHLRQCLIYIWGIKRYYGLPIQGGLIYYENRDSLEYLLFPVEDDEALLLPLLERVKAILPELREGRLPESPEDRLPPDHWAHEYCPYLEICDYGQEAVREKKMKGSKLPDKILARIIAEKIVQGQRKKERRGLASLEGLRGDSKEIDKPQPGQDLPLPLL
jgi:hypothetical protein